MNILVTGGAGFIGLNLSKKFIDLGHQVYAIDNFITSEKTKISNLVRNKNFHFFEMDIASNEFKSSFNSFPKLDEIYHLACPTGVPNLVKLSEEMLLTCSIGTKNVLDLCLRDNSKIIFTSSSEVYGDPQIFPQFETYTGNVDPVGIRSPYEEGKRFSESLIKMYHQKYGLDTKIVRVFNTYGPFMSLNDTRVIPQFLKLAINNQALVVLGTGFNTRTFCFADDLINGLIKVLEKGKSGEVYNIGGDEEITVKELAELVIKLVKSKSKIKFTENGVEDHKRRKPALDKIKQLGWGYTVDLKQGLLKTLQSYEL